MRQRLFVFTFFTDSNPQTTVVPCKVYTLASSKSNIRVVKTILNPVKVPSQVNGNQYKAGKQVKNNRLRQTL